MKTDRVAPGGTARFQSFDGEPGDVFSLVTGGTEGDDAGIRNFAFDLLVGDLQVLQIAANLHAELGFVEDFEEADPARRAPGVFADEAAELLLRRIELVVSAEFHLFAQRKQPVAEAVGFESVPPLDEVGVERDRQHFNVMLAVQRQIEVEFLRVVHTAFRFKEIPAADRIAAVVRAQQPDAEAGHQAETLVRIHIGGRVTELLRVADEPAGGSAVEADAGIAGEIQFARRIPAQDRDAPVVGTAAGELRREGEGADPFRREGEGECSTFSGSKLHLRLKDRLIRLEVVVVEHHGNFSGVRSVCRIPDVERCRSGFAPVVDGGAGFDAGLEPAVLVAPVCNGDADIVQPDAAFIARLSLESEHVSAP
ncbi:MAG: hypothetical protein L6W00_23430 [Lentisphaeria bacterium]|nr:MAG: hypothetical protein L6W00_23430 [Lentisphaeria bacterium]